MGRERRSQSDREARESQRSPALDHSSLLDHSCPTAARQIQASPVVHIWSGTVKIINPVIALSFPVSFNPLLQGPFSVRSQPSQVISTRHLFQTGGRGKIKEAEFPFWMIFLPTCSPVDAASLSLPLSLPLFLPLSLPLSLPSPVPAGRDVFHVPTPGSTGSPELSERV